jgi:quinoprotein glucose dehydrogenase
MNPLASGFGVHIGVSGHDLHGLIQGPDGRIYMSFGDRGASLTNREGRRIHLPDCVGVLRCEPDGRSLEVFCQGLRNPQELAFDDDGNLWTVDNDTAGADPCRVLHLVEGGDYGWRTSYQHMEGFGQWVKEALWKGGRDGILPLAGTVSQGPSGLAFYPGTGFGERLAGTFLHADFPGGVWAYTVKPSLSQKCSALAFVTRLPVHEWASSCASTATSERDPKGTLMRTPGCSCSSCAWVESRGGR